MMDSAHEHLSSDARAVHAIATEGTDASSSVRQRRPGIRPTSTNERATPIRSCRPRSYPEGRLDVVITPSRPTSTPQTVAPTAYRSLRVEPGRERHDRK